ncbi:MAG: glycosyltransferase family 2 protein [Phycisphaerae bacterium]|nr:glycosyltransferase family 2 protein [Phycisphaerae bacterium]
MTDNYKVELSIVLPVLNEQDNLQPLYDEITSALSGGGSYEIIYIDDGSTDDSIAVLSTIQASDPKVRVICFRRNFGQTAALSAGFKHARGRIIIPMDADGQNDPADIPRLVQKLESGFDIVSGWRRRRHDNVVTRTFPSRVANWVIARITGVRLHDFGCTLKAYRADSLKPIRLYGEMHRFIPALASWGGERVAEMVVNHRPRTRGEAKYGLSRTFKVILDLMTIKFLASFSTKPIYVFGGLGVVSFLGSFLSSLGLLYFKYLASPMIPLNRNPLLILSMMLFTTAIQFILMGLLAEILVRTYHESQGREIYLIDRVLQSGDQD